MSSGYLLSELFLLLVECRDLVLIRGDYNQMGSINGR